MVWDERIDEKLRNIDAYNGGKMAGFDEGRKEGQKEGRKVTLEEVVISMYKDNIPIETIGQYTKLNEEKIRNIISSKTSE